MDMRPFALLIPLFVLGCMAQDQMSQLVPADDDDFESNVEILNPFFQKTFVKLQAFLTLLSDPENKTTASGQNTQKPNSMGVDPHASETLKKLGTPIGVTEYMYKTIRNKFNMNPNKAARLAAKGIVCYPILGCFPEGFLPNPWGKKVLHKNIHKYYNLHPHAVKTGGKKEEEEEEDL